MSILTEIELYWFLPLCFYLLHVVDRIETSSYSEEQERALLATTRTGRFI